MAVTLDTIARKLKVSKVTVSLGLRGSRRISEEMRARIVKVADELGYKPNPMVSALMVSLRSKRRAGSAFNLCYLTAFDTKDEWRSIPVFPRYHEGARRRASELGYGLELHWMGEAAGSGDRMSTILQTRGIPGILIAPLPTHGLRLGIDWKLFSTVAIGWSFNEVPCHHIANSQFHTINTALSACRDRGFTRIGFAIPQVVDDKTEHIWLSAYLGFLARHPALKKLAPFVTDFFDEDPFLAWHAKNKPDVIVTTHVPIIDWLKRAGISIPADVAYVYLDYTPERGDFAGINQQPEQVGAAAVDLLVEQINQNRRGVPEVPKSVLIEGVWRNGPTFP
ncbi:MAG: LacI family DNA-binding transcriptional regulator [Burkholderiales bacterium]|nr:LacI family DNA-binding transcriptional regulator [Opitutaceae bacterium]